MRRRLSNANVGVDFPDLDVSPIRRASDLSSNVVSDLNDTSFQEELGSQRTNISENVTDYDLRRGNRSRGQRQRESSSRSSRSHISSSYPSRSSRHSQFSRLSTFSEDEDENEDADGAEAESPDDFIEYTSGLISSHGDSVSSDLYLHMGPSDPIREGVSYRVRKITPPYSSDDNTAPLSTTHEISSLHAQDAQLLSVAGLDRSAASQGSGSALHSVIKDERERILGGDSSDKAFTEMLSRVDSLCFETTRFQNATDDLLEISEIHQRAMILRNVRCCVRVRCCAEKDADLRSKLRDMGAVVVHKVTSNPTHVVVSPAGGIDKNLIQRVLEMNPRPFLLAPEWVESCYTRLTRLPEDQFTLLDGRYLLNKLRARTSSIASSHRGRSRQSGRNDRSVEVIELSPEDSAQLEQLEQDAGELTFDQSLNASQLLAKIEQIARRLEELEQLEVGQEHGVRCDSRQRTSRVLAEAAVDRSAYDKSPVIVDSLLTDDEEDKENTSSLSLTEGVSLSDESAPTRQKGGRRTPEPISSPPRTVIRLQRSPSSAMQRHRRVMETKKVGTDSPFQRRTKILRRRSFGGVPLECRHPFSVAVEVLRETREERNALRGHVLNDNKDKPRRSLIRRETQRSTIVDTAYSPVTDLSQTLADMGIGENHRDRDLTIDSNASGFINARRNLRAKPRQRHVYEERDRRNLADSRTPSPATRNPVMHSHTPVVRTNSSHLNRLQCMNSSEEFVTLHLRRNTSKFAPKTSVVFTGLGKSDEKRLAGELSNIGLIHQKPNVSESTRCVVSGNGLRTLAVLQAIVFEIPVVSPAWVTDSLRQCRPLPFKNYEHEEWADVVQIRRRQLDPFGKCLLLRPLGKILICNECNPNPTNLRVLIKRSGGEISDDVSAADLIICPPNLCPPSPPPETQPLVTVVSEKYILDCITRNEVLMYDGYEHDYDMESFFSSDDSS